MAIITLVTLRVDALKQFFKSFILVENLRLSEDDILDYGRTLELLKREIAKSERYNFPVSIIILDIKAEKSDYLEALHQVVKRSIRETDVFGFYEPDLSLEDDQFICLLPHTAFNEAYDLSERLRLKLLRRLSFSDNVDVELFDLKTTDLDVQSFQAITDPRKQDLTISCGVSQLEYYEGVQVLIDRASEALEMAKIKNGNCTMPQPKIKAVSTSEVAKHLN